MAQTTQVKGQANALTQIAIARPKGQPIKVVIQVPLGVWLPTGTSLHIDSKDPGLSATFKRCVPAACFSDMEIKDDAIKKFRVATEAGQLRFKDGNQKDVSLPVSFKGFGAAYDALAKE